ncbi:unnamed protein product [Rotaria sp. Silwood2]|nr:unnamed protein product [Rotaria sp. Silwood2]
MNLSQTGKSIIYNHMSIRLMKNKNLTIDSEELLTILNNFHNDRIINENSLNKHQVQYEMLCLRTGCEAYRGTAKHLPQLYILLRDSNIELKIPIKWFMQIFILGYYVFPMKFIDYQCEWKEYLFSTTKLDFVNKSSLEKATTITIIDRFILTIIIFELTRTFLIYHYSGFLHDKSLSYLLMTFTG